MAWAQASGLATGVVTTDRITGASPAAAYRLSNGFEVEWEMHTVDHELLILVIVTMDWITMVSPATA